MQEQIVATALKPCCMHLFQANAFGSDPVDAAGVVIAADNLAVVEDDLMVVAGDRALAIFKLFDVHFGGNAFEQNCCARW